MVLKNAAIGRVKNVCRCRRTWDGSPLEELLWVLCRLHTHFPDSPRSRAQCWGTEDLAFTASFSLVRADLFSILCCAMGGLYNALDADGIPKKSGITAYLLTQSREGNGTPLQYSCLENPTDGGAWWAAVHGVAKSRTRLSDFTFTFHFHALEKEMATHSSVLAWRIPGTAEPGGLPSTGSHRVEHD